MKRKKSVLAIFSVLIISFALFGAEMAFACEGGGGVWSMFRHNWARSGFANCTVPDTPAVLRTHDIGAGKSSPVYFVTNEATDEGLYYVTTNDGKVYAFNDTDGSIVWSKVDKVYRRSTGLVEDGKLIYGTGRKLVARDLLTGEKIWETTLSGAIISSPGAIENAGIGYVGSNDDNVYAFNITTGEIIWSFETLGNVQSSPAISDNGIVYVGSDDGNLYALNAYTGTEEWRFPTGSPIKSTPSVVGDKVFFGSNNGIVYALDAQTGSYVWSFATDGPVVSSPAVYNEIVGDTRVPLTVYIGSKDHRIYALDADTGALIWSYETGHKIVSSPAITEDKVFVGSFDHKLYALNRATGEYLWSYDIGEKIFSSPMVENDRVFLAADSRFFVFE